MEEHVCVIDIIIMKPVNRVIVLSLEGERVRVESNRTKTQYEGIDSIEIHEVIPNQHTIRLTL